MIKIGTQSTAGDANAAHRQLRGSAVRCGAEVRCSAPILAGLAFGHEANASFGTNLRLLRATVRPRDRLLADLLRIAAACLLGLSFVLRMGATRGVWIVGCAHLTQSGIGLAFARLKIRMNPLPWCDVLSFSVGANLCFAAILIGDSMNAGLVICVLIVMVAGLIMVVRELNDLTVFPELGRLHFLECWISRPTTNLNPGGLIIS